MSKIHVLTGKDGQFQVVAHAPMPTTNNSAGKPWKECWTAEGRNVTTLADGGTDPGVGEIRSTEKASVEAGDTLEFHFSIAATSGGDSGADLIAAVDGMVDQAITEMTDKLKAEFEFYGHTQD